MSDDAALLVYSGVLWLAFFGMLAFDARNPATRQAKLLGAVTFVVLCVEGYRIGGGG